MAKELPYFQFEPAEYLTGDISFCSLAAQGLFFNVCSYYWNRKCSLTIQQVLRRIDEPDLLDELINEKVIVLDGDTIKINFLDEQFEKAVNLSKTNTLNGKKGGRPRKEKTESKPNQNPIKSESKGIRKEEKRKEEDLIPTTEEIKQLDVDYVQLFLKDWNEQRTEILKKPSYLNRLSFDLKELLKEIWLSYTRDQIITALKGLFRQKVLPHNNTSMLSSPKHFLNNFERYLTAGIDMNPQLYGTHD